MTCREEAFACVALSYEGLVFFAERIPEVKEVFIVWAMDNVAELVEHCVDDLLKRYERFLIVRVSEA